MEEEHSSSMTNKREETVVINISSNSTDKIREKLGVNRNNHGGSPRRFTICRIPPRLREGNEKHYEPSSVSIGPYHRGKEHLKSMEEHKWKFLEDFLNRNRNKSLENYMTKLRELESKARSNYFDAIDLTSEEFVEMLLLDSCFIIEFVMRYEDSSNYKTMSVWFITLILQDLRMLENQIPFFVVQTMFDLHQNSDNYRNARSVQDSHFALLAASYLSFASISQIKKMDVDLSSISIDDIDHLLDLCYQFIVPKDALTPSDRKAYLGRAEKKMEKCINPSYQFVVKLVSYWQKCFENSINTIELESTTKAIKGIPSAARLVEAGVRIKKRARSFLDISFSYGVLEIPPLMILEDSKTFMFNIVAWEQFDRKREIISNYVVFMDFILDSAKDVEILQERGIITSYLKSSEETSRLFNEANDQVRLNDGNDDYLRLLYEEINEYCDSKWRKFRGKVVRYCLSNPWAVVYLFAAIMLIILSLLQTQFRITDYYRLPKILDPNSNNNNNSSSSGSINNHQ